MREARHRWWSLAALGTLVSAVGCVGYPDPLPPPLESGSSGSTSGGSTGMGETTDAELTTTGEVSECGNGVVEEGEECDGADLDAQTCESLGLTEGGLRCVGCLLDASGCGPATGMVVVPGGLFQMGSDMLSSELPIRVVDLGPFWIDETEVTVADYAECVADGACGEPNAPEPCNWSMLSSL